MPTVAIAIAAAPMRNAIGNPRRQAEGRYQTARNRAGTIWTPALDDEVLHARRRRLAQNRAVAFEPGEEGDDLIELGRGQVPITNRSRRGRPRRRRGGRGRAGGDEDDDQDHAAARLASAMAAMRLFSSIIASLSHAIEVQDIATVENGAHRDREGPPRSEHASDLRRSRSPRLRRR